MIDLKLFKVYKNSNGNDCMLVEIKEDNGIILNKSGNLFPVTLNYISSKYQVSSITSVQFLKSLFKNVGNLGQMANVESSIKKYEEFFNTKLVLKKSNRTNVESKLYTYSSVLKTIKLIEPIIKQLGYVDESTIKAVLGEHGQSSYTTSIHFKS